MPITLDSLVYDNVGFNQNGQYVYSEKSAGVPSGFAYLTAKVNTGTGKADSVVKWNLSRPIVATVDSDCACAGEVLRTYYARIEITIPAGSTAAERIDFDDQIQSLVAAAQWVASVETLVQPSG
jgi:hypothetical protein